MRYQTSRLEGNPMNEVTATNPPGFNVDTFWIETSRVLKEKEMEESMAKEDIHLTLPDGTQGSLILSGLFTFRAHHTKGKDGVLVRPDTEGLNRAALEWCRLLSLLPPGSVPMCQRCLIKLIEFLPAEPAGNPLIDKGRQMILDEIIRRSLWVPITTVVSYRLKEKADSKTIF